MSDRRVVLGALAASLALVLIGVALALRAPIATRRRSRRCAQRPRVAQSSRRLPRPSAAPHGRCRPGARPEVLRHLPQRSRQDRRPVVRGRQRRPRPATHAEIWEKVAAEAARRHDAAAGDAAARRTATLDAFIVALESTLDAQARKNPDPGHKPVHRLNRTEYGNAVRDLLDLEVDVDRAAAGRRREPRVRQHRRRAARLAVAARAVPRRPRARSAAWRSAPTRTSSALGVSHSAGRLAGGPRRRPAARHARRPALPAQLPAGRRVRVQRLPAAQHRRLHDRARVRAPARDHASTASACSSRRWAARRTTWRPTRTCRRRPTRSTSG